ncbi:hypothetical protein ACLOJK_036578 [Asimina triloba]
MDANDYQWRYQSIHEEDVILAVAAQIAALYEQLEMNDVIFPTCNTCGATHSIERFPFATEDVQYMERYTYPQQNDLKHSSCKGKQGMSKPTGWVETPCLIASIPSSGQGSFYPINQIEEQSEEVFMVVIMSGKVTPHKKEDERMQEPNFDHTEESIRIHLEGITIQVHQCPVHRQSTVFGAPSAPPGMTAMSAIRHSSPVATIGIRRNDGGAHPFQIRRVLASVDIILAIPTAAAGHLLLRWRNHHRRRTNVGSKSSKAPMMKHAC